MNDSVKSAMSRRFRGFLPVVVDVETGGFNAETDALLEIAVVLLKADERDHWYLSETVSSHVEPFEGANIDRSALEFNGIIPDHPLRFALSEKEALNKVLTPVRQAVKGWNGLRLWPVRSTAAFRNERSKAGL